MSKYTLAHEDDHAFTIQEPTGHTFKIAKAGLDKRVHERIKKMMSAQKMSKGGMVIEEVEPEKNEVEAIAETPASIPAGTRFLPGQQPGQAQTSTPTQNPSQVPMQEASTQQDLISTNPQSLMQKYNKNQDLQIQGISGVAAANAQISEDSAKAYEAYEKKMNAFNTTTNKVKKDLMDKRQGLIKDIETGKVNPSRVWQNMDTGNKVLAGISLMLGGIGANFSKSGVNMAAKTLDGIIDADIEEQKQHINRKQNLLSQNLEEYRDIGAAEAATRLQMNYTLQAQLQKAAAQSGSQIALNNADMQIGQLQQQAIPLEQELLMLGVQAQSLGATGQAGIPVGQEPVQLLGNKDYQAKRVVLAGRAYQALTPEDANKLKAIQVNYEPVLNMVKELEEIGSMALNPFSDEAAKAEGLRARLVPMINQMHGLDRLTHEDIKVMGAQIRNPERFFEFISKGGSKNSDFLRHLAEDVDSAYKTRLINYQGPSRYKSFTPGR